MYLLFPSSFVGQPYLTGQCFINALMDFNAAPSRCLASQDAELQIGLEFRLQALI